MAKPQNTDAPTGKRNPRGKETPPAHVPAIARWALRIGGGLALVCGALLSFFALFGLAVLNGWPRTIAWALPGCVDVLTATAAIVAMSVPRHHRGARIAHWCAGVSLAITVGCNVEYHALLPAHWTTGHIFLVATGAVPAIVVELIIVMQMYLGDGATLVVQDAPAVHGAQAQRALADKKSAAPGTSRSAPRALDLEATAPQGAPENAPSAVAAEQHIAPGRGVPVGDDLARAREKTSERTTAILDLMLTHGPDAVTGKTVATHFGIHESNGKRALAKVRELPDLTQRLAQRARETSDSLDDPQREAASA